MAARKSKEGRTDDSQTKRKRKDRANRFPTARTPLAAFQQQASSPENRITLRNISGAVFITDDSGRLTFICPNSQITFGYSPEEVLGKEFLDESRLETLLTLSQMADSPIQDICEFALREGIRLTQSKVGFVGFVDEKRDIFTIHSWAKEAMDECRMMEQPTEYILSEAGIWAEAVRRRQPIIVNDYSAPDPRKKGYPQGHMPLDRVLSIPVFDGQPEEPQGSA